ncbi:hypothetical protein [Lysobacter gummosus]
MFQAKVAPPTPVSHTGRITAAETPSAWKTSPPALPSRRAVPWLG